MGPLPRNAAIRRKGRLKSGTAPWLRNCLCDERGRILPNLANLVVALRAATELADAFTFDEMLRTPVLAKRLPRVPNAGPASADPLPRPVRDTDVSQLQEWLQRAGLPKIGNDMTHQAVDLRAQERAFHRSGTTSTDSLGTRRLVSRIGSPSIRRKPNSLRVQHRPDVSGGDGRAHLRARL
jgi:hypothetical protein